MTPPLAAPRSHWHLQRRGIVRITGPDKVAFIQRMCTQDVRPLHEAGQARWALFLNAKGRLIDEVRVLSEQDALLIETAPHRAQALVQWLTPYTIMEDVHYEVVAEAAASFLLIAHAPPATLKPVVAVLQSVQLPGCPDAEGAVFHTAADAQPGQPTQPARLWATCARPAYGLGLALTACDGTDEALVADALQAAFGPALNAQQQQAWQMATGVAVPELDYPTPAPPFELRLGQDSIHWHKGCYIGQEIISRLEAYDKVARLLMGVRIDGGQAHNRQAASHANLRLTVDGTVIGKINRVVADANGLDVIGLCTVKREWARPIPIAVAPTDNAQGGPTEPLVGALFDCPQWQR